MFVILYINGLCLGLKFVNEKLEKKNVASVLVLHLNSWSLIHSTDLYHLA
ncbi:hypothetical protein Hanom_Chr16g01482881 [Helianthus anomalus]